MIFFLSSDHLRTNKMADSVDKAFEDLTVLKMCMNNIHRFSPGIPGEEMRMDGDRCALLGHWSLITAGLVECSINVMHTACRIGRIDVIESRHKDIDLNQTDEMGWTVLHTAMLHSDDIVRTLRRLGVADTSTHDGIFASSLNPERWERATGEVVDFDDIWSVPATARQCAEKLAELVLECPHIVSYSVLCNRIVRAVTVWGPSPMLDVRYGLRKMPLSVVQQCCHANNTSALRVCLELGVQADGVGFVSNPLLCIACHNGNIECVRLLLQHDADVNISNWNGMTPLQFAAFHKNYECMQLVLEHGAAVDKADYDNQTPLYDACTRVKTKREKMCVLLLLQHHANPTLRADDGKTPIDVARVHGSKGIVEALKLYVLNRDAGLAQLQRLIDES